MELGDTDAERVSELNASAVWYHTVTRKDKVSRNLDTAEMFLQKIWKPSPLIKAQVFVS